MNRIVIFGNSGSGKTTLAKRLSDRDECAHLDLDDVAWKESNPPIREDRAKSQAAIGDFIERHANWVIEGCYSSLIEHAAKRADRMVFLNVGVGACVANCRSRPWEPGKYPSKEAQDRNLAALIEWVKSYETREDEFSLREHRRIFDNFNGPKSEINANEDALP